MDREAYVVVTWVYWVLLKRRWLADAEVLLRDPPIFRQSQLSPLSLSRQPCLKLNPTLPGKSLFARIVSWISHFFRFLLVGLETPGILPVLWQSRIWEERASWTSLELYLDSRGKTTAVETTTPVPPATAVETATPVPPAAFSLEVRLEMAEIGWELLFFGLWEMGLKIQGTLFLWHWCLQDLSAVWCTARQERHQRNQWQQCYLSNFRHAVDIPGGAKGSRGPGSEQMANLIELTHSMANL